MDSLHHFEEDNGETVFRDVIFLALAGFVAVVLMLLPHLHPPTTDAKESVASPGTVIVEARWGDELLTDVDLWVQAPGDIPVGYSSKGGQNFNLLRDDLGAAGDPTRLNYEVAYARGTPAGEYTVNLHLYSNREGRLPVEVDVFVSVKENEQKTPVMIATEHVQLTRLGEELTVVRFTLTDKGKLVTGSKHKLPRKLRGREDQ